ncbi:MAG: DUF2784 domain-containing protein [Mycobacterium sp.]|nr:DUF2784 domain-containing protein [Mycobacterium sp.]
MAFLVGAIVAVHIAFIAFMVLGGFLTWWWPHAIWPHLAAVLWGLGSTAFGLDCPLTDIERWARGRAAMSPLPSDGFIAHYLADVLYPASATNLVRVVAVVVVLVTWAGWAQRRWR